MVTGIGIAEGIADIVQGVESGSWVDGVIGGLATGLEALAFVLDPLGGLVSWGVAWLIEHVKPLSDALDWLAGDPDQITAYAGTWKNVSKAVAEAAVELADAVGREVASWGGDAGDAYRSYADRHVQALRNLAEASGAMSSITTGAALLVALVRELVRDIIAEFVSILAVRLWEWLAIEAGTLGIGTPVVVAQVSSLVAKWAAKIARLITGLVRSLNNLVPIVRRLDDLIDALKGVLRGLRTRPALPTARTPGGGTTVRGPGGPSLAGSPDPVVPGKLADLDPTGPRATTTADSPGGPTFPYPGQHPTGPDIDAMGTQDLMGNRRRWRDPDFQPTPPTRPPDSYLPGGDPVYHGSRSTAIGYDSATMNNFDNIQPLPGHYDVVVHGTGEGLFRPGHVNRSGHDAPTNLTHPTQIADAIRNNPAYNGEPVRLVSCHSAVTTVPGQPPAAQQVADALGVPVTAPTNTVGVDRFGGPGQTPMLAPGARWVTFYPRPRP